MKNKVIVKNLSLVIFDWDGTLMNSLAKIVASMQLAAIDCDLEPLPDKQIENIVGLGLPEAILVLYPTTEESIRTQLAVRYSHHFVHGTTVESALFPGVHQLLGGLKTLGLQLAVATGKSRKGLDRVLAEVKMTGHFDATRCADETKSKPSPLMVEEILADLNVSAESAIVVGDTEFDLEMASLAGVAGIGVTYGAHSQERLEKQSPLFCVHAANQLLDRIKVLACKD